MKLKSTFTNWLHTRYRVVIRNEENLSEKSSFSFSYAKLIAVSFLILVLSVALGLLLGHTILRAWLNPAYIEQENSNKLMQLYTALNKLEEKNVQQEKFIKLFQSTIEEKGDPTYSVEELTQEPLEDELPKAGKDKVLKDKGLQAAEEEGYTSSVDKGSLGGQVYMAEATYNDASYLSNLFLFKPMTGVITTPFNPQIQHYGLDIVGKENEPIKSIADGTVVLSTWTVETGWVIIIQHSKSLLSIYKHNATLFKKVNDVVRGGDVIAIMGNSGEFTTGPHLHFELWYDGNAVNPEQFITF